MSDPSPVAFGPSPAQAPAPALAEPTPVDPALAGDNGQAATRMAERARQRRHRAARTNIKSIRFLRYMAVAEATAFLTLLTVGILHATTGWGTWELFIMGNVHGAIFTTYLVSIVIFHRKVGWGPLMLLLVLLAGFVPGGGLMVERWALAAPGRED